MLQRLAKSSVARACSSVVGRRCGGKASINSSGCPPVLGIKRETINPWEQRTPLIPNHVERLVKEGIRVLIQPSNRRCFCADEFEAVGAHISEDLSPASLILGVKRPTDLGPKDILPNKTYAFFTHTIKAQPENMPLLDALLERNVRMIDYECMVDSSKKRLVAFGKYAGLAGTIDILHGLGIRLLAMGHATPLLQISMAHNYTSLQHAQTAVRMAGYEIARNRMPDSIGPLIFVIHGDGNVARGAKDILNCMPVRYIQTDKLQETAMHGDKNVIYACVVTVADYMEHLDCKPFVYSEYLEQPERYRSRFIDKIAPYMSVLLNCTYWDERVDRILTRENVKRLKNVRPSVKGIPLDGACPTLPHRLLAICDISADLNGSVEFTDRCTTIDAPFVLYDLQTENTTTGFVGDGVLMCSIDNMPTQLPVEASEHFGNVLFPYLSEMIKSDASKPFNEFLGGPEVKNAVITSNGQLTPRYAYIDELRITRRATSRHPSSEKARKNVLVLGAGHVVSPLLEYLNRDKHTYLTVVSNLQEELSTISSQFTNLTMRKLDVLKDKEKLGKLMREHDLVISMVPWKFHPTVVKECINQRRNLLTTSYCTPVLKQLEHSIQEAGITAFMEIGLDPGIDHLLTKECVDDVKQKGGRLLSYRSYTGGLPAPENSDNPLRYKFSWSPEAALSTVLNGAKYLENGKIREIPADGSLMKAVAPISIFPALNLEGYPNRDSIRYINLYGLEDCETVIRGTLRYGGYAEAMRFLLSLGLLNADPQVDLQPGSPRVSWRQLMCRKLSMNEQLRGEQLKNAVMQKVSGDHKKFECLNDLGLLSEDAVPQAITPLASISLKLSKFLAYGPNERDLIVMAHEMIIDWPQRRQREQRKVNLVVYGNPGQGKAGLAMSRTVGLPAAIAAKMILEGKVTDKGIVLPLKPQIYKPILQQLKAEGIQAQETSCFTDA